MKRSSMDTHLGNIEIQNDVIAQYAGAVCAECFGVVGMAGINVRDGIVKLLKLDNLNRGVNVELINNKLTLDLHIVVAYGVNIMTVSNNIISDVKYKVEEFAGIEVEKVNVFVEGVRAID